MRTVDPSLWSKRAKGRGISLARPLRFGRRWGFEERLRGSLRDALGEFWRSCSVGGVRRIVDEDTTHYERYRWILLLSVSLIAGTVALSMTLEDLVTKPPLLINLQSAQHSIEELPFPAIALCSFNVISQRALNDISELIVSLDKNRTYAPASIRRNLLDSGALLTLGLPTVDLQFAHYLQNVSPHGKLNISELMRRLAPSCNSMLVKCSWAGKEKPCDRLFATRITSVGFCCVFNGRYEDVDRYTPPRILKLVGQDNGLSVAIREDTEDFAYVRKPSVGIEVLVFDGTEYPFLEGGSVRVQLAPRHTSVFYTITTRAQAASSNLDYFNEAWRGCRLPRTGNADVPRWRRSYSWCLLECRRYAALQLCGCVPYTLQPGTEQVCTLNELSCLNKHREMFIYYHPIGYDLDHPDGEALSEELQDALFCPECRADCARPLYVARASHAVYQNRQAELFQNTFTNGLPKGTVSVLRFFYSTEDQYLYAVMSNHEWFETLAYMSSQWVTLLGISLVTVFELVFHCTVRWRHHYVRRRALLVNVAHSDIS